MLSEVPPEDAAQPAAVSDERLVVLVMVADGAAPLRLRHSCIFSAENLRACIDSTVLACWPLLSYRVTEAVMAVFHEVSRGTKSYAASSI